MVNKDQEGQKSVMDEVREADPGNEYLTESDEQVSPVARNEAVGLNKRWKIVEMTTREDVKQEMGLFNALKRTFPITMTVLLLILTRVETFKIKVI